MSILSTTFASVLSFYGLLLSISAVLVVALFPSLKAKMPETQERPMSAFQIAEKNAAQIRRARARKHAEKKARERCISFSAGPEKDIVCPPVTARKSLFANMRRLSSVNITNPLANRSFSFSAFNINSSSAVRNVVDERPIGPLDLSPLMKGRARFTEAVSPVLTYPATVLPNIKRRLSRPNQNSDYFVDRPESGPCPKSPLSNSFASLQRGFSSIRPPISPIIRRGKSFRTKMVEMKRTPSHKTVFVSNF